MKTRTFLLITLLCAALASLQSINATTITVTNTNDSGAGSLRQALVDAVDGDTINFDVAVAGTITLTSGQLVVNKSVTISGPGASSLSVDGNYAGRVFYISSGKTVTIAGLTIANGYDSQAGGILIDYAAALTVNNSAISGNSGGAIYNYHGTLTVNDSTISGNSARGSGGAIYNDHGTLTVSDSTINDNSVPSGSRGGAINNDGTYSGSATLTINNSTINGNSAYYGGAIFNDGFHSGSATLTINNSTISGNSATNSGGGVFNDGSSGSGVVTVSNSTFSGNSADANYGAGGGVFNSGYLGSGTLAISNSTFSDNSAGIGGAVVNLYSATLTIGNTILNTGSSGTNIYNAGATLISLGYNLSSDDASAFLNQTGDLNMTDPMLGPLQDNGGPTFTHELLTGSPAIDAGDPSFTPPPDYDQRGAGFNRVVNGRIDIGAFEVQTIVCPQPQGYWKTNPDEWPVTSLTLGSQTYTDTELLRILRTRVGADASLILAYQLIAAKLNIANGANGAPVTTTITDADAVLSLYSGKLPYRVRPNSTNGHRMVSDGAVLNNYNNGLLTPGCTPTPTPTPSPTP